MRVKEQIRSALFTLSLILFGSLVFAQETEERLSDENITNRIETELMFQAEIPSYWVDVKTTDGIATLTGSVNNLLAKDKAEKVAMAVKGVEGVINQITVDPPFRSDKAIESDVEDALLDNPATDSYELDVAVADAAVTLSGEVQSWQEKQLAAYVAKGVRGVQDIQNNIKVVYAEQRPDIEIKREIQASIDNNIRLEPHLITVEVNDGAVTLSGKVGSVNEKRQLESYAWTTGVQDVQTEQVEIVEWAREDYLKKSVVQMRSDEDIREAVKLALLYDPRVMSFKPEVNVNDGVVTLSGVVDNLRAKRAAEADVRTISGVTNVRNNLKVRPESVPEDGKLATNVNEAFVRDAAVERFEIDVEADNGVVTLRGEVDNYYEKYRAGDLASEVKGVVEVNNNIEVETESKYNYYYPYGWNSYYPSPYIYPDNYYTYPLTDAQIKENIEDELWWSPFVNENEVKVEVESAVATLTGTVNSYEEKDAAVENAYEGGADAVVDRLEVQEQTEN